MDFLSEGRKLDCFSYDDHSGPHRRKEESVLKC